ncbi:MAG TPA: sulfur transferase domain-containing protein, partial [Candidatus Binatia bacterium]|nr:sulfur transferase domain-containing protein [Candidatus Binatia bacterium]
MTLLYVFITAALMLFSAISFAAEYPQGNPMRPEQIQKLLSADVPRVLCLDENFATGGQPTGEAYAKAAASGFKSILSLRMANEGIDITRERSQVESKKLRYFNIPVNSSSPRPEQADEFLRIARDKANHPMLVNCATANRVGAF